MKKSYVFGVVGYRIGYSKSPEIFQAIADLKGFSHAFVSHDINSSEFDSKFPGVLKSGIDGFSVTIPHKKRVMAFMDEVKSEAQLIGAVNSVGVRENRATGFNTDTHGFAAPLERHRDKLDGGAALIFGAGGAARAVAHSLSTKFGIKKLHVIGRNLKRVGEFCSSLGPGLPGTLLSAMLLEKRAGALNDIDYSIVVNCTPLGGWNHLDETPIPEGFVWRPGRIYYDLSYNRDNKIVALAANNSLIAFDGTVMLVAQAIRSFELWTDMSVDFEPVYQAVFGQSS